MSTVKTFGIIENPREIRKSVGLNQIEFWGQIGVTQSGGSRYESGRSIPKTVRELLRLVYIERVDLAKVNGEDMVIAQLLKVKNPEVYKALKKEAKVNNK